MLPELAGMGQLCIWSLPLSQLHPFPWMMLPYYSLRASGHRCTSCHLQHRENTSLYSFRALTQSASSQRRAAIPGDFSVLLNGISITHTSYAAYTFSDLMAVSPLHATTHTLSSTLHAAWGALKYRFPGPRNSRNGTQKLDLSC